MEKYLALLRGINVSGKHSIKMVDLKKLLDNDSFTNVKTYIQSGNILFDYKKETNSKIEKIISALIEKHYNYQIEAFVRTLAEFRKVVHDNPFTNVSEADFNKLMVVFLNQIPENDKINRLGSISSESEVYKIKSDIIYLYCKNGYGNAKINNNFLESKLKVKATTRNWKTILKLSELLDNG